MRLLHWLWRMAVKHRARLLGALVFCLQAAQFGIILAIVGGVLAVLAFLALALEERWGQLLGFGATTLIAAVIACIVGLIVKMLEPVYTRWDREAKYERDKTDEYERREWDI